MLHVLSSARILSPLETILTGDRSLSRMYKQRASGNVELNWFFPHKLVPDLLEFADVIP